MKLLVVALVLVAVYLVACQVWPYKPCPRCSGGKHPSPTRKFWRNCTRCGGTGRQRRIFSRDP